MIPRRVTTGWPIFAFVFTVFAGVAAHGADFRALERALKIVARKDLTVKKLNSAL